MHANEGGLVGRVAQVGRQIVRSLLHPNEQGHDEMSSAATRTEAAGNQGELSDQEQAEGVVAAIANVSGRAVEADETRNSQGGIHRPEPEYCTLAEVATEVAAQAAQANLGPLESQAADSRMLGKQTALSPMSGEMMPARGHFVEPENIPDVIYQEEVPALAAEAGQVEESGRESDIGDQDDATAAASIDVAEAREEIQPVVADPSFPAAAAVRTVVADEGANSGAPGDQDAVHASAELVATDEAQAAGGVGIAAPSPAVVTARDEAAAGDEPYRSQDGTAAQVQPPMAAESAPLAGEPPPDESEHGLAQDEDAAAADTALSEVAIEELSALADEAAADVQSAAELPVAPDPPVTEVAADVPAAVAEGTLVFTVGAAVDEQPAVEPDSRAEAAQDGKAGQEVPSEQTPDTIPEARTDASTAVDQAEAEVDAPAAAAEPKEYEAEPVMASVCIIPASSTPEEEFVAAAAAAAEDSEVKKRDSSRVDVVGGLGLDEEALAAAAAAAADEFIDRRVADEAHEQAKEAGANAKAAGGKRALAHLSTFNKRMCWVYKGFHGPAAEGQSSTLVLDHTLHSF